MQKEYETEVRQRWGSTDAYKEFASREQSPELQNHATLGLDAIFAAFAQCLQSGEMPQSATAQNLVQQLQQHITRYFYTCTPQILSGLGQMYVGDVRFQTNIDRHGPGTAAFAAEAIRQYTQS